MRWLLLKDLQILRRSPLLVGVLIGYSVLAPSLRPRQASACIPPEHARTHRRSH